MWDCIVFIRLLQSSRVHGVFAACIYLLFPCVYACLSEAVTQLEIKVNS